MATVTGYSLEKKTYSNKPNKVVNLAGITWYAFEFTNSEGRADVGLAAVFGKDPKDGGAHIAIIEPARLKELLTEPHAHIRDGVRKLMGAEERTAPEVLPDDSLEGADLGGIGEGEAL